MIARKDLFLVHMDVHWIRKLPYPYLPKNHSKPLTKLSRTGEPSPPLFADVTNQWPLIRLDFWIQLFEVFVFEVIQLFWI